jgi:replicative DNA helicase
MDKVIELVKELKFSFRESEREVYIDCPFCNDTRKRMGINKESNAWHCFNCNSRGKTLSTFKKALGKLKKLGRDKIVEYKDTDSVRIKQGLGPALNKAFVKNEVANKYLIEERNLSQECVDHFKIGARSKFVISTGANKGKKYDAGLHIALPYYEGEKLVNVKYRAVEPRLSKDDKPMKWRRETGGKTALYNYNVLNDHDYDEMIICESEIDCMSIWAGGYKNVVGLSAGAEGFKQEWYDLLERYEKIFIVLDNDKAGQDGAEKLARRLGMGRCFNVILPENAKDPNDFFKLYPKEDFESYLNKGKQFNPKNITNLKSTVRDMISNIGKRSMQLDGLDTGWKQVNNILGKVGPGNLITIAAKPKVGKTTLAMNWLLYLAYQGFPSFNYQCEMEKEDMVIKYGNMVMYDRMPEIPEVDYTEEGEPLFNDHAHKVAFEEACDDKRMWLKSVMLRLPIDKLKSFHPQTSDLIDDNDGEALDKVCDKIKEAVQRFGCKLVVFDNLHFLCRGDRAKEQIDKASRRFKLLAKELQIVFVLITHPRKTNHNRALTNDDLKDSASIFQDSDAIILLHRAYLDDSDLPEGLEDEDEIDLTQEGAMDPLAEVKVTARRHKGGKTNLFFNDDRALFKGDGNDYLVSMQNKLKAIKSKNKKRR